MSDFEELYVPDREPLRPTVAPSLAGQYRTDSPELTSAELEQAIKAARVGFTPAVAAQLVEALRWYQGARWTPADRVRQLIAEINAAARPVDESAA